MKKTVLIALLFLLLASVPVTAASASLAAGRSALFNHGEPTCSGIIAANNHFRNAVQEAPDNPEANFFYALSRLLVSGLEKGQGPGFTSLLDLFEAFGITRTANDDIINGDIYYNTSQYDGVYHPPLTVPEAGRVSQFFIIQFVSLLDDVLANLTKVNNTIAITLTSFETGDTAVEIDYGDVLIFKSAVNTLKGLMLTIFAYNIDGIDTAELIRLCQADTFKIQNDLIDHYPSALRLISGGAAQLAKAKAALLAAINLTQEAFDYITAETDNQNNDLFSLNEEDIEMYLRTLAQNKEAKASLNEDRPAKFSEGSNDGRYNFNSIFGSASKNPLDLRSSLPPFNTNGGLSWDNIPGTSYLNRFLPDKAEQYTWINGDGTTTIPAPPILSSPTHNANVAGTSVNLSWSASSGATQYWLWARRTSENAVIVNQNIGNKTSYTLTGLPNNGDNYYWMVRAGNSGGWSGLTAARRFFNGGA